MEANAPPQQEAYHASTADPKAGTSIEEQVQKAVEPYFVDRKDPDSVDTVMIHAWNIGEMIGNTVSIDTAGMMLRARMIDMILEGIQAADRNGTLEKFGSTIGSIIFLSQAIIQIRRIGDQWRIF